MITLDPCMLFTSRLLVILGLRANAPDDRA
jgi:hypothetical protein